MNDQTDAALDGMEVGCPVQLRDNARIGEATSSLGIRIASATGSRPGGPRWAQVTLWTLGALWAARSLQSFSNPKFTSPGSAADWFAVASVSIALGLLPLGVWILLQRSNLERLPVRSLSLASMVTAGTAAVANVVEDGFGLSGAGTAFFAGIVGTLLVLLVAAAGLAVRGPRLLALVPLAMVIGMVNLERAGGLLVLVAWGCLALSPHSAPKMAA